MRDKVFGRVIKYIENNIDVCVVQPGSSENFHLKSLCKKYGRSYLYSKENRLALSQNLAIKWHPNAEFIYKINEDVFITEWFFRKLKKKYKLSIQCSDYIPWAISPVVNINPATYKFFLQKINKVEDYESIFGEHPSKVWCKTRYEKIYKSWPVAKYIRENSLGLDNVNAQYFDKLSINSEYSAIAVYYAIWCFMFHRSIWEDFWWFFVAPKGKLWQEERKFLENCMLNSRPIILCENCLCGHFWFQHQKNDMKNFFEKNKDKF